MIIARMRTLAAIALFCLVLPDGVNAQEDAGREKANPSRDNTDESARPAQRQRPDDSGAGRINPMAKLFELMDTNGDGEISAAEMDGFIAKVDTDGDKRVSDDELRVRMRGILSTLRPGSSSGRPGGSGGGGRSRGGRQRRSADDPRVSKATVEAATALRKATHSGRLPAAGSVAPDFSLSLLEGSAKPDFVKPDGDGKVSLSAHKDKKPVVLIFGSYT